ncbi:hypothetical protein MF406_16720 [Georgenia sp. TF02-10]|uniref:hypothetical protein n=1 Tax=Georgenia sp. TF02-10 TaxID=2917725 RepID=UPI001FA77853|nr:hypothetical protein [Georgenia sp. TF02-10]UNX54509.1 hypothetical protein MF406_16720 [Georgenia sp. TF02-10]
MDEAYAYLTYQQNQRGSAALARDAERRGRGPGGATAVPIAGSWWHPVLRRWPGAVGLTVAVVLVATGAADRETLARGVSLAALCFLGAAALGRPWVGWAGIAVGSAVVVASELLGLAWWVGVGVTALGLVVVGLLRRAPLPALTAQSAAMAGFGGLAVAAVVMDPDAGLVLAGLTLASHAGWDAVLYRRNQVVPRSLAEFCMFLDVPLGIGLILLALA